MIATLPRQSFQIQAETFRYRTGIAPEFLDITDDVEALVRRSGIRDGWVLVYSQHTTAALKILEHEPLLLQDLASMLRRIAPPDAAYYHNDFNVRTVNMCPDEHANAHAHCQHLLLGTSETIPLADGRLRFGPWQRIFLIELDSPRERGVVVQIVGM